MGGRWFPHVTVACIARRDDRYLMVQETVGAVTVFNQPAGHLEANESLLQAVVRETLEETAWEFAPRAISGIYQFIAPNGETYLRFAFCGDLMNEYPDRPLDSDIDRVVWFTREELENRTGELRSRAVLICIEDYECGCRIPLETVRGLESA